MIQNLQNIPKNYFLDAEVYLRKGISLYQGRDEKLYLYNVAIKLNPLCYQAYIQKGICLRKYKQIDEAIQMFDKAQELNPQDKQIYINKGNICMDLKDYNKALQYYEIAAKLDNEDVDINLKKAKTLVSLGRIFEAIQIYKEAIQYKPPVFDYEALGNQLFEEKKYKEALIMCDMVIQLCPQEGYLQKGKQLLAQGEIQESFLMVNEALKFEPSSSEYLKIGDQLFDENKYDEALIIYDMLIILKQNLGFQRKVRTLVALQRMEEAFQIFQSTIKHNEKYWKYQERGNQIFNDYDHNETPIIDEMKINFKRIQSQLIQVKKLLTLGKIQEAFLIFKETIKYDPYHWEYQELGDLFFLENKYEEAFIMYDVSITKKNHRKGYLGKGRLFLALINKNRDIKMFTQNIKYTTSFYEFEQIGNQFFDEKLYEEAFIFYDMLIKLDPRKAYLIKGLKLIKLDKIQEAQLMFQTIESKLSQDNYELNQYAKLADQLCKLADQLCIPKEYEKAFELYDIMIQLQPKQGYLEKAKKLLSLNKNEEAFKLLNEAIKYDPSFYEYKEIGDKFYKQKKYDEALYIYDLLFKLKPRQGYLIKGKLLIQLGQIKEALQILNEAIYYAPSTDEYQEIGNKFFDQEKYEEAFIIQDMVIKLDPKSGYLEKGKKLIAIGKYEEALQVINEAIKFNISPSEYYILGNLLFDKKKYEESLIIYDKLLQLDSKLGYIGKAKALIALGKFDDAFHIINKNKQQFQYFRSDNKGDQRFNEKKYEEALIYYHFLDSQYGYIKRAKTFIVLGRDKEAFQMFNQAIKYKPSYHDLLYLGDLFFYEKIYEYAFIIYDNVIKLYPKKGYLIKGVKLQTLGKIDEAQLMFNEAISQVSTQQDYLQIGEELYQSEYYEEAIIMYDMIIKFNTQEGQLGKIKTLIAQNMFEQALQVYDELRKIMDLDTIMDNIPNLGYILFLNRRLEDTYMTPDSFYLEDPWKNHKDLVLQELGLYDVEEEFEIQYFLCSQLVRFK